MNCNVYLFGKLSSGYMQYPEDGSSHVLKNIYSSCKATTQIVIRRDASMMYYCYIRKLNGNKYFGLCVAVNGYYIARVDELFPLFENTIEKIVQQGIFIHFAKDGSLTTSTTILKDEEEEIDTLSENLRSSFEALGSSTNILPQVDYSVEKDSVKKFNALDDKRDIVRASYTYGYTFIYKDKDYDTIQINSYRSVLRQLNDENKDLKKRNEELKEQNAEILRQKKQFKNVVFLVFVVIGCGVGIFYLYDHLNFAQREIQSANHTISLKDRVINEKNERISIIRDSVYFLKRDYYEVYQKLIEVKDTLDMVCGDYPFMVTSCSVDASKFSFDYYATEEKNLVVTLKAINERTGNVISNSHNLTFYKGEGSKELYFNYRLSVSDYYSIVLECNGRIIAGKRW